MSFKELNLKKMNAVCHALGGEWRINHLDSRDFIIIIFNPTIKDFSIHISQKDGRLVAMGFFESKIKNYPTLKCSTSVRLSLDHFINHLKRKVIIEAINLSEKVLKEKKEHEDKKLNDTTFLNLLKSMSIRSYRGTGGNINLSLNNSFSVDFNQIGMSCSVKVNNLSRDNAVKVIAFVKGL